MRVPVTLWLGMTMTEQKENIHMAKPALWDCAFSGQAIDDDATKAKFDKLWHDFLAAVSLLDGNEVFEDGNCNGTWYSYKNGEKYFCYCFRTRARK